MTQTAEQRRLVRLAAAMNQKALRLGAVGEVSAQELAEVTLASEGNCAYCGAEIPLMEGSFDHIVPYARGGLNRKENLCRSCVSCNRTKGLKSPEDLAVYAALQVKCVVDGKLFRPRWADWKRGYGKTCSRVCAGKLGGSA